MNRKELFYLSLTIFLTIIAWLVIEIYKVDVAIQFEKSTPVVNKKINLDFSVIKELKIKKDDIQ